MNNIYENDDYEIISIHGYKWNIEVMKKNNYLPRKTEGKPTLAPTVKPELLRKTRNTVGIYNYERCSHRNVKKPEIPTKISIKHK